MLSPLNKNGTCGKLLCDKKYDDRSSIKMKLNRLQRSAIELFQDKTGHRACNRSLEVTINFHPDRLTADGRPLLSVLGEDGYIRSQFETGSTNGGLSAFTGGDRWKWESVAFHSIYDGGLPTDRPKYGSLNYQQHGAGASPRFGSSFFKLMPHVLDRTTFCYPESWLGPKEYGYSVFVENLIRLADSNDLDALDNYIEAHIHGSISIKTDVEMLVLDPCYKGTDVEKLAENLGCGVEWHNGFIAQVSTLHDFVDYRGAQYIEIANIISEEGVITPCVIGAAANRQLFTDQDLKKVWHYLARFGNLN